MWPKSVTGSGSLSLFFGFLQVCFLLHVHGGNTAKIVDQSHTFPSVSMRLRNSLYPNDEQVNDDEGRNDDGKNEHVNEIHPSHRQGRELRA